MSVLKKSRLFPLTVLALLCALLLALPAAAQPQEDTGTLTVLYPLEDTLYHIYRVGSLENGDVVFDRDFAGVDTSDLATAAGVMAQMIQQTGIRTPIAEARVQGGKAVFTGLPMAVYLVTGEPGVENGVNYYPTPFLLSMPQTGEDGNYLWTVEVTGKREMDMDISVVKRWVGDRVAGRPASITVHLVLDGKDYGDPVKLNYANQWSYTWENLPPKNWYVREDATPRYSTVIVRDGNTFVITNTWKRIPQTGQLWWPVTALTLAGLGLLCLGILRRRKGDGHA